MGADKLLSIKHDGDVTIKSGDLVFATADKGIVLGATSNTAANTLSDYEEGTWTPSITSSSGGSNMAYGTSNAGNYTKVGNLVYIQGTLQLTAVNNLQNGELQLKGFPFNLSDDQAARGAGATIGEWANTTINFNSPILRWGTTEKMLFVYTGVDGASTYTVLLGGQLSNNFFMRFSGVYKVA
jgi:hypothetical protein